ncbi:MAG TPA: FG-GAP-like repeat-containing protein, partial [Candidatus Acidoferrum sp.]|nr:FG-GAP-like repeat-containing protein [Candidatus Acidoferrum sp.]
VRTGDSTHPNRIIEQSFNTQKENHPEAPSESITSRSMPKHALAADFDTTINVLVLRFNFQYETVDDPNTTGRGVMNLSRTLVTTADSNAYYDSVGHWIDPPPHDSAYFNAHMRALNIYWGFVSEGRYHLTWDIFPAGRDSLYALPHPMSHYGGYPFDSVAYGLGLFFQDCIQIADADPRIDFSKYQAIVIFHAGADHQNDIGFPPTPSDLFTGFIKFGDSVAVAHGTRYLRQAVIMPEYASQDNRVVALNAVFAHEFGHQLGLFDVYNTRNFLTMLGDFALHDNNGFGSGIDYGFKAGKVFGAIPVYDDPWSRAYLGFDSIADFRQGRDIRLVAPELSSKGLKIARIPISENEYYLIENRIQEIPGQRTFTRVDSSTDVILGPSDSLRQFNGAYDYLIPGSGMLIYRVDEAVGYLNYTGDGQNNFEDNTLQWDPQRPFISLEEADGLVDFGGYYEKGFGDQLDVFRDDGATSFTPNTNPPSLDHNGGNTHIYITNIRRDSLLQGTKDWTRIDSVMYFDVETDKLAGGFPVRSGAPTYPLSVIADDLDRTGQDEIIVASGHLLSVMTSQGENFLRQKTNCQSCPLYFDTASSTLRHLSIETAHPQAVHVVPLFAKTNGLITAGPVTTGFGATSGNKFVVVGDDSTQSTKGRVTVYSLSDENQDGQADTVESMLCSGVPVAISGGDMLWVLCGDGKIYRQATLPGVRRDSFMVAGPQLDGVARIGDRLAVLSGDSVRTRITVVGTDTAFATLEGSYTLGPIAVDVNRDGKPEIVAFSADGRGVYVTVDTSTVRPQFSTLAQVSTSYHLTTNPIAADLDGDGYPDIVVGGTNVVYAFDKLLQLKNDFPLQIDDRYPNANLVVSPICANIDKGGRPDLIFPTDVGNLYSFGSTNTSGFPLNAGDEEVGPALYFHDSTGGKLAYLGQDGWMYVWDVDPDTVTNFWPMGGHDAAGSFCFAQSQLQAPSQYSDKLPLNRFFNYPNPVTTGETKIRYFLGESARRVTLTIYDLSGRQVRVLEGPTGEGDNDVSWDCSGATPGVYRCTIEAQFATETKTGFTDMAVIR